MKNKQKVLSTCFLSVLFVVSSLLLCFNVFTPSQTPATKGVYGGTFNVFAETEASATIGEIKGMKSIDNTYLLLATSFDVDDIANYSEVGYKVSKNGAEAEKVGAGSDFYTGIVVRTGETTTKEYILGENIFQGVVADGMIVAEMEYDVTADYTIQPYIIANGGDEITVEGGTVEHAHEISIALTSQPTSNKIASYGKLDTTGMVITATCTHCDLEEDVTAKAVQEKYTTGNTATFTYEGQKVDVEVEEVTGYSVAVKSFGADYYIGSGSNYNMNKMPETVPADSFKTSGYVGGTTNSSTNQFKIHNEKTLYQGEYANVDLLKIGNFDANETITYFVWSDVAGYAEIAILASQQATSSSQVGTELAARSLNTQFSLEINGDAYTIDADAKTKAFTPLKNYAMDFSYVTIAEAGLNVGWNTVKILPISSVGQPQLSTMTFDFIEKLAKQSVVPTTAMDTNFRLEPTPELLAGQESTGAIFVAGKINDKNTHIAQEGDHVAVKSTIKGSIVTYYVYMEKDVVADVKLTGSSAAAYKTSDATYEGGTPNAVHAVVFGSDVSVAVNGANQTLEGVEIPEYIMGLDKGAWSVCQHYVTVDLLQDVEFKAGWNTITFTFNTDNCANLAALEFTYPVD